ncbi:MAG: hypothetical protein HY063_14240 [Bacteroidetes bacterium]|nr:hypothetical protein [Bacteroidota bacterium]
MEIPTNKKVYNLTTSYVWFDEEGFFCSVSKKRTAAATLEETKKSVEELWDFPFCW